MKYIYNGNGAVFVVNDGVLKKTLDKDNYKNYTETPFFTHNNMQRESNIVNSFELYSGTGIVYFIRYFINQNKTNPKKYQLNQILLHL